MITYIFPYLCLITFAYLYFRTRNINIPRRIFLFLIVFPATLLTLLRGNVGTDTLNYLQHFKELTESGTSVQNFEPGFDILSRIIVSFGMPERASMVTVSFITILVLIRTFSNSKLEILYFSILVFPCYYYDMTMNGIRYGLSFALVALAIRYLYREKIVHFLVLSILAVSVQYSSFLIVIIFILFKLKRRYLLVIGCLFLLSFPFLSTLLEFLILKQEAYSDTQTPTALSGIAPLFICLCLYLSFLWYARTRNYGKIIHLILFLELASFYLAKFSYAGLRFQALFQYTLMIYIINEFEFVKKKKEFLLVLFVIGVMGMGIWLKNYSGNVEIVEAPYIPYKFFWE